MSRRLKIIKRCAQCNASYRPSHAQQMTCSYQCSAIRRTRMYPAHHSMVQANQALRAAVRAKRTETLTHLSPYEAYRLGRQDGYSVAYQRMRREERRA
jgi:hypothetical protein